MRRGSEDGKSAGKLDREVKEGKTSGGEVRHGSDAGK